MENLSQNILQLSNSNESKSAYIYRLLSVQDYLLREMEREEDIFKVQDFQKAIFRLDDAIGLMSGQADNFRH